jgi:hypothetical protein
MPAPSGVYMVNYFPVTNGGYSMWSSYSGFTYQSDMTVARSLGFNCMRIILAARTGVFDFPDPTAAELANLTDFYNRAKAVGMNLHVTLFDHWRDLGLIAGSKKWLAGILSAFPDYSHIQCFELKNEPKFASTDSYTGRFDAGWIQSRPSAAGAAALGWYQYIVPWLRTNAPGVKITVSCTSGYGHLQALISNVNANGNAPDWYEWHCYAGRRAHNVYSALRQIIAVAGGAANLFIGETGLGASSSEDLTTPRTALLEQQQSDYIQTVRWACQELGLPEPAPWILYDMKECAQRPNGQTCGLLDVNGNAKTAGKMYQAIAPGSAVPPVDINPSLAGPLQADANTPPNNLPPRLLVYKGNGGAQPISAQGDNSPGNTLGANPWAVLLTGSSATSGTDNPPALEVDPPCWPVLSGGAGDGQSYTFTVWLKATGDYQGGSAYQPSLAISWNRYTQLSHGGKTSFISNANGPQLRLTSTYQKFSLTATAPAGVDYARLFVRVGHNAGSIWVGGWTWGPT